MIQAGCDSVLPGIPTMTIRSACPKACSACVPAQKHEFIPNNFEDSLGRREQQLWKIERQFRHAKVVSELWPAVNALFHRARLQSMQSKRSRRVQTGSTEGGSR